jgi:Arc/MetJ family transcription regulator
VSKAKGKVKRDKGLTYAYQIGTMMHMRTTLILDDELLEKARSLTGLSEKTAVVHAGLRALIVQRSAQRLAALGGTDTRARVPRRRRPMKASR